MHGYRGGNFKFIKLESHGTDRQEDGYHGQHTYSVWWSDANIVPTATSDLSTIKTGTNSITLEAGDHTLVLDLDGLKVDGASLTDSHLPITFVLAIDTSATTGTGLTNSVICPVNGTITKAFAYSKTAPIGSALIFDVNVNGSTIWSTQANRLKILANNNSGSTTTFNTTEVSEGDIFTIDLDQVGSTTPGQDITVELLLAN